MDESIDCVIPQFIIRFLSIDNWLEKMAEELTAIQEGTKSIDFD